MYTIEMCQYRFNERTNGANWRGRDVIGQSGSRVENEESYG
jgi:hypothetical protein